MVILYYSCFSPSEILLRTLLLREFRMEDPTVATILQYWVQRYEDKMAKLINDVVNNKTQPSPNKRKRNQSTKASAVPLDQVLSHLNHLRTACGQTTFFALETMQDTLQTAQNQCSETQKKKYSDLFALIEEEEEEEPAPEPQRKPKSSRGRKPKGRKKQETESEEESSEVGGVRMSVDSVSDGQIIKTPFGIGMLTLLVLLPYAGQNFIQRLTSVWQGIVSAVYVLFSMR